LPPQVRYHELSNVCSHNILCNHLLWVLEYEYFTEHTVSISSAMLIVPAAHTVTGCLICITWTSSDSDKSFSVPSIYWLRVYTHAFCDQQNQFMGCDFWYIMLKAARSEVYYNVRNMSIKCH